MELVIRAKPPLYYIGMPPSLLRHLAAQARNNAWANHRLLEACALLAPEEFVATRTSFFPSIKATLNHILTVDWYYVDALERSLARRPPNADAGRFFDPAEPFERCADLAREQRAADRRLIAVCDSLTEDTLDALIEVPRRDRIDHERAHRLLAHLFQHDIHHRGQVHAMLAGTRVKPPQLDEFFCAADAPWRASDFAALGFTEASLWEDGPG